MIDKAKLNEEFKEYTAEELQYIHDTQQDLYSPEELTYMEEAIARKEEEFRDKLIDYLPEEIECEKCGGPNKFSNETCEYCGHPLNKSSYLKRAAEVAAGGDPDCLREDEDDEESYLFQKVISFLIPLVGFIMGAIMMSGEDPARRSIGKTCIILGIVSAVIYAVIANIFWGSLI